MSGGQMMSFIDKPAAYPPTEGPCHRFCLDLSTHLPSLLTALSNKWRCKKRRTGCRSDFLGLETERFWCSESSCTAHFLLMCGIEMIQIAFCLCEIQ